MRIFRARGSAELEQIVSDSATQGLWLGNEKGDSQVIGEDRSRLLGRGILGKLVDEEEEQRREYKDFGSDLGNRNEHVACHASALVLAR